MPKIITVAIDEIESTLATISADNIYKVELCKNKYIIIYNE